jgi:hypothetical protein
MDKPVNESIQALTGSALASPLFYVGAAAPGYYASQTKPTAWLKVL